MTIRLRGHHLLCLLGYRGMGYSPEFCENMTVVYETLRQRPETLIEVVKGPDDLCAKYPADKPYHCDGQTVYDRDAQIVGQLGLHVGGTWSWTDICAGVVRGVQPGDISLLCRTCPWEPYGVCREGVHLVHEGQPLPPVSGK